MSVHPSLSNTWITFPRPNPDAHLRLFCFPYAGGAASIFYAWPDGISNGIEVCPVQLPGRESRLKEAPFTCMERLLEALLPGIRPYLDKPFALFGHSMGAMICFALSRQLRRQGDSEPIHLFVSGSRAPHIPDRNSPIHALPDEEFVKELRHFNGTPEGVLQNAELMQLFLPILRSDLTLLRTYSCENDRPLDCPITVFGGLGDPMTSNDDLMAWHEQTQAAFTLRMFPGDHFFMRSARTQLTQAISDILDHIPAQASGGILW